MSKMVTILIGNGLGMAIDLEAFSLKSAMKKISESDKFNELEEIFHSLGEAFPPKNEDELSKTQLLLFKFESIHKLYTECSSLFKNDQNFIERFKNDKAIERILEYKDNYMEYCFEITKYFYELGIKYEKDKKFKTFIKKLQKFITGRTNLATLNYDPLLYLNIDAAFDTSLKKTLLSDGIWQKSIGFNKNNLEEKNENKFGKYLHLHGTPLFYTDSRNMIFKSTKYEVKDLVYKEVIESETKVRNHFVLTNQESKSKLITRSYILKSYFEVFKECLDNSNTLNIIGYSGEDIHVNELINSSFNGSEIIIVEWNGNGNTKESWEKKYPNKKINHIPKENILEYDFEEVIDI